MTWPSAVGVALSTPGTFFMSAKSSGVASRPPRLPCTPSWPLMLDIWRSISKRKPFMTDMTTISVPTPKVMPISEKAAITEMKPSSRRARR